MLFQRDVKSNQRIEPFQRSPFRYSLLQKRVIVIVIAAGHKARAGGRTGHIWCMGKYMKSLKGRTSELHLRPLNASEDDHHSGAFCFHGSKKIHSGP